MQVPSEHSEERLGASEIEDLESRLVGSKIQNAKTSIVGVFVLREASVLLVLSKYTVITFLLVMSLEPLAPASFATPYGL